jgi:hypothetical protein
VTISVVNSVDCADLALAGLYLDTAGVDLRSPEALAGSLRRAASFQCPTTPRRLVDTVMEAVQPLDPITPLDRQELTGLLDMLVSAGDLVELPPDPQRRGRLLFLGPPSFVEQRPGRYLVMGTRPFGAPLLGTDMERRIEYKRHVRVIELDEGEAVKCLDALGLQAIRQHQWVLAPIASLAEDLILGTRSRLDIANRAGVVTELSLLDPATSFRFYKGRWRQAREEDNGDFVARRSQEYGSDLWCYIRVTDGVPAQLVDFPTGELAVPGRDEAWRLQAAIDSARGSSQVFRVVESQEFPKESFVDFWAPLPTWADRYLELIGTAVSGRRSCLFSYIVPDAALTSLGDYLADMLWMQRTGTEGTP